MAGGCRCRYVKCVKNVNCSQGRCHYAATANVLLNEERRLERRIETFIILEGQFASQQVIKIHTLKEKE